MKNIKVLTLVLSILQTSTAFAAYTDISYDLTVYENGGYSVFPSRTSVLFAEQQGIMTGYPDGTFRPNNSLNRAELMKILVAASGATPIVSEYSRCFPDVQTQWFAPFVCYAAKMGWVEGYPDGKFYPEKPVNWSEAFKMIVTSRGYALSQSVERGYPADAWYAPYVETLFQNHIVHDVLLGGDREVLLGKNMTRVEVAQFIYRTYLYEKKISFSFNDSPNCSEGDELVISRSNINSEQTVTVNKEGLYQCVLTRNFDPYSNISNLDVNFSLKPLNAEVLQTPHETTYIISLENGKAQFEAIGYGRPITDFYDEGLWEFDLQTRTLYQLNN